MAAIFSIMVVLNIMSHGAHLDAPADPSSSFDARPEWYFRPLFQALKYFHGPLEAVVALGAPVIVGGVLLSLPFVDRSPTTNPKQRLPYLGILAIGAALTAVLTVVSFREDANNPAFQKSMAAAEESAHKARELAKTYGVPAAGGAAVYTMEPGYLAKKIFARDCAGCHRGDERKGPEIIAGFNSRQWISAMLRNPSGARFYGVTDFDLMKPVTLQGEEFEAIVELVYAQTGAEDARPELVAKGQELFDDGSCSDCHSIDWETEDDVGPNLGRRGSVEMLKEFIVNPSHPRWFGEDNDMPSGKGKYSDKELTELAEYIVSLRDMETPASAAARDKDPAPARAAGEDDGADEGGDQGAADEDADGPGDDASEDDEESAAGESEGGESEEAESDSSSADE
jgi:ubiquinol-cytochrome c reductase cytochrome b subunit